VGLGIEDLVWDVTVFTKSDFSVVGRHAVRDQQVPHTQSTSID
jgi:hypothetical protein